MDHLAFGKGAFLGASELGLFMDNVIPPLSIHLNITHVLRAEP